MAKNFRELEEKMSPESLERAKFKAIESFTQLNVPITLIARRIGYIYYHRPLMYGGSGQGVELRLHTYHDLIAEFEGREDEFRSVYWKALEDEDCGSANFATRYSMDHPGVTEEEIARYSVTQWRKISERMGVPIPHEEMKKEFGEPPS